MNVSIRPQSQNDDAKILDCAGRAQRRKRFWKCARRSMLVGRGVCESGVALRLPPHSRSVVVIAMLLCLLVSAQAQTNSSAIKSLLPGGADKWEFVWGDEFDGPDSELEVAWKSQNSGSSHILSSRWRENSVVTNGLLRLVNRKEKRDGQEWTSGNIWTRQMYQYGYFECRYRYAAAEGVNNSFWLMPTGTNKITKGKLFEIDINEGHYPNKVANNIHNHSDTVVVEGRKTHPSSSRQFTFGTRSDVTIQLELPVTARKLRFSSTHSAHFNLGEFRVYNVNPAGYPDALSPTADKDKPGLVNFAREAGTKITTSGFLSPTNDTRKNLTDGKIETRWTSQREGDKWVEFEFAGPRTIGCVQFLNGLKESGSWKGMVDNYRVAYHDGTMWVAMASFDIMEAEFNFARDFQVHGLDWNEKEMIFYLNGKEIRRVKNEFCFSPANVWLSEAIIPWAGHITDAIDGTAMEVDYVRIYRRKP
jgi:beta-glucanase (GH16 family)